MKKQYIIAAIFVSLIALTAPVKASIVQVTARFDPPSKTVNLGDLFTLNIVADIVDPVVGWGLDMSFANAGILGLVGTPLIPSPPWSATTGLDGDGLVGLANPFAPINGAVSGSGVVLATLTFSADVVGQTDLLLSTTLGDLTEGFPLTTPGDFATVSFQTASVTVLIPEPLSLVLLLFGTIVAVTKRRRLRQR